MTIFLKIRWNNNLCAGVATLRDCRGEDISDHLDEGMASPLNNPGQDLDLPAFRISPGADFPLARQSAAGLLKSSSSKKKEI